MTHIPFRSHSVPIFRSEISRPVTEEVPAGHLVIFFQEILHEAFSGKRFRRMVFDVDGKYEGFVRLKLEKKDRNND